MALFYMANSQSLSPGSDLDIYDSTYHFQARTELPASLGYDNSQLRPVTELQNVPRDDLFQCHQLKEKAHRGQVVRHKHHVWIK